MKHGMLAAGLGLAMSGVASAAFVGYTVVATNVSDSGQSLTRYEVFASFNGATDTVLNVFNLCAVSAAPGEDAYGGFWHKDLSDYNGCTLSQQYGTWSPQAIGSATSCRPYDSYLLIGGVPIQSNTTNVDPSWNSGGSGPHASDGRGWNRPDLVNNCQIGWFNSSPPNLQGRVGIAPNTATTVKLAQFVLSQGHGWRTYSLTTGWNNGAGGGVGFGNSTFTLPAPGAVALLGLAGLTRRRRR